MSKLEEKALEKTRALEMARLKHDQERRQARGWQLGNIGKRLGITRYPGEEENVFFARIEAHPGWETVRDEVYMAMKLQRIKEPETQRVKEPEKLLSFIEELRKV